MREQGAVWGGVKGGECEVKKSVKYASVHSVK